MVSVCDVVRVSDYLYYGVCDVVSVSDYLYYGVCL